MRCLSVRMFFCTLILGATPMVANAAATALGPTPYLQLGDTPAAFYNAACQLHIEDFEDGSVDSFLTISPGAPYAPNQASGSGIPFTDSVDGDDTHVDGSGLAGWSFFSGNARKISITFDSLVTSAGLVFTDGDTLLTNVRLEAFNGATSVGVINAGDLSDGVYNGTTAEDRFLGFRDMSGISRIEISMDAGSGIEIDHVQWQACAVPEPATFGLAGFGLMALAGLRRRSR